MVSFHIISAVWLFETNSCTYLGSDDRRESVGRVVCLLEGDGGMVARGQAPKTILDPILAAYRQ